MRAATTRVPDAKHARNLAKRFRENGEAYFRFSTALGIAPTNFDADVFDDTFCRSTIALSASWLEAFHKNLMKKHCKGGQVGSRPRLRLESEPLHFAAG